MPASDIETLYDFETPLEKMFAHLFGAAGVAIYTPANSTFVNDAAWQAAYPELIDFIFDNEAEIQKHRPRVELFVAPGNATGKLFDPAGTGVMANHRCDSFEGTVSVHCITEHSLIRHRLYRAKCRKIMGDNFPTTHTPYHDINKCVESGTSLEFSPDDGSIRSTLTYDLHFNIRPDAWPA